MIQYLSHLSEEYTPYGNVAAEGILNQLGKPGLDLLSILVRETVQNSWDARLSGETMVHFTVAARRLTAAQLDFLRQVVFFEEPAQLNLHERLSAEAAGGVQVLTISDRGTTGLNGPIRADAPDDETGSRNFVNFLFNVGQSKGHRLSGGTYGYGKSILYRASEIQTICIYTRCIAHGQLESRFMAATLQSQEERGSGYNRYTGRHWWGRRNDRDGILEPVTGPAADEFARNLGLPLFTGDETGTTCMILLPMLDSSSPDEAMQRVSQMLLWYCWPKMLADAERKAPMRFAVYCDERPVLIPDPREYPPLQGFVRAMKLLRAGSAEIREPFQKYVPVASQRPKRTLGRLALVRFVEQERKEAGSDGSEFIPPVTGSSHHVALMRNTELVVKYLAGDQLPISKFGYAGVFVADPAVDASFAKAEPPTHDDWNTKSMTEKEKEDKSIVTIALRRIQEEMKDFATPQTTSGRDGELFPLGEFADRLGSMLIGVAGNAAYVEPVEERIWNRTGRRSATEVSGTGNGAVVAAPALADSPARRIIREGNDEEQGQNYENGLIGSTGSPGPAERSKDQQHPVPTIADSGDRRQSETDTDNRTGEEKDRQHLPSVPSGFENAGDDRKHSPGTGSFSSGGTTPGSFHETTGRGQGTEGAEGTVSYRIRSRAKIELLDEGRLELLWNKPVMLTSFRVKSAPGSKSTKVEVEAGILLDNGAPENEPPAGRTGPDVLCWIDPMGKARSGSDAVLIPATDDGIWQVAVSLPDDALLRVNLLCWEVF